MHFMKFIMLTVMLDFFLFETCIRLITLFFVSAAVSC
jgi:hypothetical protein